MNTATDVPVQTAAAIVAVYCGDEVLLVKDRGRDEWGLPGGTVLPGENLETAAIRKIRQETGLTVAPGTLRELCKKKRAATHTVHLFGVQVVPGTFDTIKGTGPGGHVILRCKASEVLNQQLRWMHRTLLKHLVIQAQEKRTEQE